MGPCGREEATATGLRVGVGWGLAVGKVPTGAPGELTTQVSRAGETAGPCAWSQAMQREEKEQYRPMGFVHA